MMHHWVPKEHRYPDQKILKSGVVDSASFEGSTFFIMIACTVGKVASLVSFSALVMNLGELVVIVGDFSSILLVVLGVLVLNPWSSLLGADNGGSRKICCCGQVWSIARCALVTCVFQEYTCLFQL